MKPLHLIAIACLAAAVAASTSTLLADRVSASESTPDQGAIVLERLAQRVAQLGLGQQELAEELSLLRERSSLHPVASPRLEVGQVDAAVARWMEEHGEPVAALESAEIEPSKSAEARLNEALAVLDGDLSDTERQRIWREFAAEGLTDSIVEAWEARAAAEPNNPDMQVALGGMYLNKIFEVGNSPEAGMWATRADRSFDAALELDERHWDARFTKAVSLSFWPPVFGKQGEAIQNFEILVAQQTGGPGEPRFAQTHLLLGNLYTQVGNQEKALAAWETGLALFPGDEELAKQLSIHSGQ